MSQSDFSHDPVVAVLIVNYGTADLAAEAVRSVLRDAHGPYLTEVHLVDNGSATGDAARLSELHAAEGWQDRVTLYLETENHGFGRGNNVVLSKLGARALPPDYVLLLNPDARLEPGALATLADFLVQTPQAGCVGAQISKPTEGPVSAAFRFPTAAVEFVSAAGLGPLTRLSGDRTLWMSPDLKTQRVDWVAGAAVMFRMKALEDAGFFDPDFFLYFEEVELMWRLAKHGWHCWYVAEAKVLHHEGAATNVRSGEGMRRRRPHYWYQSQALYFRKTASAPVAAWRAMSRLAGTLLHLTVATVRGKPSALPTNYLSDYARHTLLPVMGMTPSGKNDADPTCVKRLPIKSQAQRDIEETGDRSAQINDGMTNRNPAGIGFWPLIREDLRTHDGAFFAQGFWALFWHRFGNLRMVVGPRLLRLPLSLLYRMGAKATQWFCGIDLPYTVVVGRRVKLEHFGGMILVARAIGDDVILRQNTTFGISSPKRPHARPTIGDGVDVGTGAVVLGGIMIGHKAVIGANAVITKDCPANVLMAGVPAKVISGRGGKAQPPLASAS